jgi:hypothetical protein
MGSLKNNGNSRHGGDAPTRTPGPRILMPTLRNFARRAFRCGIYEAQDVLVDIDNVDLICLEQGWGRRVNPYWLVWPLFHDASRKLMFVNPGLKKVRLRQEYDLFVAFCQSFWDLPYVNAIQGWRDHCKTSVCWIEEIWANVIPRYKYWLHALSQFDHIFIAFKDSAATLSNAINRPCHWLPGAADTLRFSPYPSPRERVIDVYSIGRRYEGIHRKLLEAAKGGDLFYVYDTFAIGDTGVYDHRQHRDLFANVAKRSRYFTVAAGRVGDQVMQGQLELGYRYYEGAAAGTVMIGQAPDCEAYRELLPWPDAVIPIEPDGSDVISVLNALDSDPERVHAIRRRNAVEALLRHDWVYRWKKMFRVIGMDPSPGMAARERRLKDLADLATGATDDGTIMQRVEQF